MKEKRFSLIECPVCKKIEQGKSLFNQFGNTEISLYSK